MSFAFHETRMGNEFYNGTAKKIASSLERIADALGVSLEGLFKGVESIPGL